MSVDSLGFGKIRNLRRLGSIHQFYPSVCLFVSVSVTVCPLFIYTPVSLSTKFFVSPFIQPFIPSYL